jgi:hypothetical protein
MKTLLAVVLAGIFSATLATSAFADCSGGHVSASLSKLQIAVESEKPEVALSTYDPAKTDVLLDTKVPAQEVKTSD